MAFRSYLDGGNEADSKQYKYLTLAALSGFKQHWTPFDKQWGTILRKHKAPYLHTTDAVGLCGKVFTKANGWNRTRVDEFITDCVKVIEKCALTTHYGEVEKVGPRPSTVTVVLADFIKARRIRLGLGSAEQLLAVQSVGQIAHQGLTLGGKQFELYFDRGEPFYGHIRDRMDNRKARRATSFLGMVTHCGESNMQQVPALQAADALAWSINHAHQDGTFRFEWQERLVMLEQETDLFEFDYLCTVDPEILERFGSWKLPKRKAPR